MDHGGGNRIEAICDMGTDSIPYFKPHDSFVAMLKAWHAGNKVGLVSRLKQFHFTLQIKSIRHNHHIYALRIQDTVFDDYNASVLHKLCKDGMDLLVWYL